MGSLGGISTTTNKLGQATNQTTDDLAQTVS
jgi:hypothetical protein